MGPITLIDKSTIQSLDVFEVRYLDHYCSLVISPILLRGLLSTLAKEPEENKDWEKILSILAAKVDTMNSYVPLNALTMAGANLLGGDIPLTGQVPLAGGKRVRSRYGTYGVIFEEQPEKAILRDWKYGNFSESSKKAAQIIREMDHAVDLSKLQKQIEEQLTHFPKFNQLVDLVKWLDDTYFNQVNCLRKASLTGSDDPGVERIARNQKLVELELLDEAQFDAEIEDAWKSKNLATLAVKQRKYKSGMKPSILKSKISELLLPETEILNQMQEKILDLESALKSVQTGNPDRRRKMHKSVEKYRKQQAEKGEGE